MLGAVLKMRKNILQYEKPHTPSAAGVYCGARRQGIDQRIKTDIRTCSLEGLEKQSLWFRE